MRGPMSLNTKAGGCLYPTSAVQPGEGLQLRMGLNINGAWGYKSPHPSLYLFRVLEIVDLEPKKQGRKAGEGDQWLKSMTALAEDPGLVNSSPRKSNLCAHKHMQTDNFPPPS